MTEFESMESNPPPPAEHGQERWTIYPCGCGAVGGNPSFERAVPCGRRSDGFHDAKPVEVVPADREREAIEARAHRGLWERIEAVEARERVLVEALDLYINAVEDFTDESQQLPMNHLVEATHGARAALDRIQEGR